MKSRQTYLVTGAAGFIGSYLCRALLKKPNAPLVVGIDTLNAYYNPAIKKRRVNELSQNKRFLFYKTSVLAEKSLVTIITKHTPDVLIHTAADVGIRNGETHPVHYFSTNVLGTVTTLEAASRSIRRAVVFSSSSVYGSTHRIPFRESELINLSTPLSVYGTSKVAMETAVRNFHARRNIPITIVRPFSIYGPDGRPDMLPLKLLIAAKTKTPIELYAASATSRDWTYIDDCIGMILALLEKPNGLCTVNIGNGQPVRLDRLVSIAQKIIGRYGYKVLYINKPANPIEITDTWADTSIIRKMYTKKTVSFERGFTQTADFFFNHEKLYGKP